MTANRASMTAHPVVAALAVAAALLMLTACSGGDDATGQPDDGVADALADAGGDAAGQLDGGFDSGGGEDIAAPEDIPAPDIEEPNSRAPGEPCDHNGQCQSGFCILGTGGYQCATSCSAGCPAGMTCKPVARTAPDMAFVCVEGVDLACLPCQNDSQCGDGVCEELDDGMRCLPRCDDDTPCPDEYVCALDEDSDAPNNPGVCQPATGSCDCDSARAGAERVCSTTNDLGTCFGVEVCAPEMGGWGDCSAVEAADEICDGVDNDCDGAVDDGLPESQPCENAVDGVGTCTGVAVCSGARGWLCSAAEPSEELCDFIDNDCDGATDEGFQVDGVYATHEHCGACGVDCDSAIPNAESRCDASGPMPVCLVVACAPGFYQVSPYECAEERALLCQPCADDVHCPGGACREVGGGSYCSRGCSDEAPCPEGYTCEDVDGEPLCTPTSGSCDCREDTAGSVRPCVAENAIGTCYGVETCEPALGWTGCTARPPSDELCNGLDDDCDGEVDEGLDGTRPCEKAVEGVGTCSGTETCLGSLGWVCDARDPMAERCNYEDDDCDGDIDEGFQVDGVYASLEHCGGCDASCVDAIPNSVEACDVDGPDGPRCVATDCDPGFTLWEGRACVLPVPPCVPCVDDESCYGGQCVDLGDGNFCVEPCAAGSCADGYACQAVPDAGDVCVPEGGSCTCSLEETGSERPCYASNEHGTCWGGETCGPDGWSGCDAPAAAEEVCNGLDDDCDGLVDEDLGVGEPCDSEVAGVGTCGGVLECRGADGWVCGAPTPSEESCDFRDNDCDGEVDEEFTVDGAYASDEHCGVCGRSCDGAIANATATCDDLGSGLFRCVVTSCDPGYVAVDDYTCVWLPNVQCAPCNEDAECFGAATCEEQGDGSFCLVSCEDGAACPDGASCVEGICQPDTGSCDCSASNVGALRRCSIEGAEGTCHGVETCAPEDGDGWGACDAQVPVAELCNGLDDDCDGLVDEGLEAGPCSVDVEGVGSCAGTRVCLGGAGWICDAPTPAPEACDFRDNDCDGETDEDFKVDGAYGLDDHCGTCFSTCDGIEIEQAEVGCVVGATGAAACGVVACDDGLVPLNAFTCAPPTPVACAPCQNDGHCLGESCVQVGGSSFCLERCADDGACARGYVCTDIQGEAFCLPPSGTCGCNEDTAGTRRVCELANEFGTCIGYETCDPATGWLDCTAAAAAAETCNGLDDDCDGVVDDDLADRPAGGGLCERTNEHGTCVGAEVCLGAAGWACDAAEPAMERCDGVDNDCDGETDEGAPLGCVPYYVDADGDGAGLDGSEACLCAPEGDRVAPVGGDCDDTTVAIAPSVQESCNEVDDDCDGLTDEAGASDCTAYHADGDLDGWGSDADVQCLCAPAPGYTLTTGGDCDDGAPATNPEGEEVCDGSDNDCDGVTDEEDSPGCTDYYRDSDADGFGDADDAHCLCAPAAPYSGTVGGDCSDQTAAISPDAPELCNGFDDDCDGDIDEEDALGCVLYYVDGDSDGFGDPASARCLCAPDGAHTIRTGGDCDDDAPAVNPDGVEICNGAVDDDCDGETDEVLDGDPAVTGCGTFYRDADEDGHGDATATACSCGETGPTPYTAAAGDDCDDGTATTYPGASEACNGVDDDCDGITDVGELADYQPAAGQPAGWAVDYDDEDDDGIANCVDPCPVYVDGDMADPSEALSGSLGNPWATIQEAIDASGSCAHVLVFPGTYTENVRFNGHHVRLESVAGPEATVIDGRDGAAGAGAVVTFDQGEREPAALVGFTVTNGSGNQIYSLWKEVLADPANDTTGGGVFVKAASPLIQGNIITDNDVLDQGGGIFLYASYAHVIGNEISYNIARDSHDCGAGILATNSEALVENNRVHHNQCTGTSGDGAGLMAYASSDRYRGNVFTDNWARDNGSGCRLSYYGEVIFEGNLIYGNDGQGLMVSHGTTGRVLNNTIVGNSSYGLRVFISSGSAYSAPLIANNIIAWNGSCGVADNSDSPFTYMNNNAFGHSDDYCQNFSGNANPTGSDGNISEDPRFVAWSDDDDFTNDDFRLQATSPCHDAGADLSQYGLDTDHAGQPRPRGAAYDMGAYEVQD